MQVMKFKRLMAQGVWEINDSGSLRDFAKSSELIPEPFSPYPVSQIT